MQNNGESQLLGDVSIQTPSFQKLNDVITHLKEKKFSNPLHKQNYISQKLYELIHEDTSGDFLLPAVLEFIDHLHSEDIFLTYNLSSFELWLNQYSELKREEELEVRGKIVGKYIPRSEYQIAFPIGSGKTYSGTHFVTAHGSPDVDTIVATFWGWIDAFAAKISEGFHVWNVPDGPPPSQVEIGLLFYEIFGKKVFYHTAKFRNALSLSALDLVTQEGFIEKLPHEFTFDIDHERSKAAVIIVDHEGNYLGDWRHIDVEGVRQVINAFNICLRWIESELHVSLISLFSRNDISKEDVEIEIKHIFEKHLIETEPAKEFTFRQQKHLQAFLQKVLGISRGLETSFGDFINGLHEQEIINIEHFIHAINKLKEEPFFDVNGKFIENRPLLFASLQKVVVKLAELFLRMRNYIDTLDVSMKIKTTVFNNMPSFLSHRADLDEVKAKMQNYPYLTVNLSAKEGQYLPLGVIYASDIYSDKLGTVTLRDFCNREETKVPSYLEVISVIDHHKSSLTTSTPSRSIIADTQSSNVLVAAMAFQMHDSYSHLNMTVEEIQSQIDELKNQSDRASQRLLIRLLKMKIAYESKKNYFVSPTREFIEYLHYLYAIFDDTDLLTKMTPIDVEVVKDIINRLKSLQLKKVVEIVHFDDLPKDDQFVKQASKRLLQNEDMYSLYSRVYKAREKIISEEFEKCANQQPSAVFTDTKIQNKCARVGQTKLFNNNVAQFNKLANNLRSMWVEQSNEYFKQHPEVDLFMHMTSTVSGAEDLYKNREADYKHKDQLWIYIPQTEIATQHLKLFLNAFQHSPDLVHDSLEVEFLGQNGADLKQIFEESFIHVPSRLNDQGLPIAVIYYKAGTLNSRKSQITPYLPKK